MSTKSHQLYSETIETGNIVNKDTFNSIRDDIESAISAGQHEVIANRNAAYLAVYKNSCAKTELPNIEGDEDERGHWGSKAEFILSCVGFSVRYDF